MQLFCSRLFELPPVSDGANLKVLFAGPAGRRPEGFGGRCDRVGRRPSGAERQLKRCGSAIVLPRRTLSWAAEKHCQPNRTFIYEDGKEKLAR